MLSRIGQPLTAPSPGQAAVRRSRGGVSVNPQIEKFLDFFQCEAEVLGAFDEAQALHGLLGIDPVVVSWLLLGQAGLEASRIDDRDEG